MKLEIEIRDSVNDVIGVLDIGAGDNLWPFAITKKLSDITTLTERSGVYTKTFKIPGTNANNQLLRSMFHLGARDTGNMTKEKPAVVRVDGVTMDRGRIFIKSTEINGSIEYEAEYYGSNMDWVVQMKDLYLADLDWEKGSAGQAAGDIEYTGDTIEASWTNTYDDGDEWVFPLINRGNRQGFTPIVEDFRPELFLKRTIEHAFNAVGFNVESNLFDTDDFKQLILTYTGSFTTSDAMKAKAKLSAEGAPDNISLTKGDNKPFPLSKEVSDANNNYNGSSIYTAPFTGYFNLSAELFLELTTASTQWVLPGGQVDLRLRLVLPSGSTYEFNLKSWTSEDFIGRVDTTILSSGSPGAPLFINRLVYLPSGTTAQLRIFWDVDSNPATLDFEITGGLKYTLDNRIGEGMLFRLDGILDNHKYPMLKIISDIGRLFNLHWTTNNATRTVFVEQRDSFFAGIDKAEDWSDKIDISKKIKHHPINSDRKRFLRFLYAEDSEDGYVKGRNEDMDDIFASHLFDFGSEYDEGEDTLSTSLLAATYPITDAYVGLPADESPHTSRLWSEYAGSPPDFKDTFAPRVLNYQYGEQVKEDGTKRKWKHQMSGSISSEITDIPYALMYSTADGAAPINLSWGYNRDEAPLYKKYYSTALGLVDQGKLMECFVKLSPTDWKNLDFRNPVYIERPGEIKGYYYIQEIADYNPISKDTVKVTLLNYKNKSELPLNTGVFTEVAEPRPVKFTLNTL